MNVLFRASFAKDLKALSDKTLLKRVRAVIEEIEQVESLLAVQGVKRLRTHGQLYRIRIGDFRLGLRAEGNAVEMIRFLHRREIYNYFP